MAGKQINLRLDEALLAAIDAARGGVPRNAWLVSAIKMQLALQTGGSVLPPMPERVKSGWVDQIERSPEPRVEPKSPRVPARPPKQERIAEARRVVGGMVSQPRPLVQKRGK